MLVRMGHQALAEYYRFPWRVSEEITDSLTAKTEFFQGWGDLLWPLLPQSPANSL